MALAAIPFGLAIGLSVGMLGGGGSVLAVPVLVYVLGQSVHEATTASLVIVAAGALAGGLGHHRGDRVCWRHAAIFSAAAIPGIVGGTVAGEAVDDSALIIAFAAIMAVAAVGMWRRAGQPRPVAGAGTSPAEGPADTSASRASGLCPPLRAGRDIAAGVLVGFMTGFFGVGGGFLIVPTLAIALAFSMRLAVATSLAIITITSAFGLAAHLVAGRGLDLPVTLAMAAACAAGAYAGASLAARIPARRLARGFAVLLAAVAVYLLAAPAPADAAPRILLTGDSMMQVIENDVAGELRARGAEVSMDSRVGSGITKPFVFDWVVKAPAQARLVAPDATVVFLGAGDVYPLKRRGRKVRCCGGSWVAAWADRARKMIRDWRDVTPRAPGRVYWLTLPAPRDRGLAKVHAVVNRAIRRAVRLARTRAATIDLVPLLSPGYRYSRSMASDSGRVVVRERDGVHLAPAGARIAAGAIAAALARDGVVTAAAPAGTTAP